jgi:histidinol-phosphate aminotransferase
MPLSVLDLSGIENVYPAVATVADSLADVLLRPAVARSTDSLRTAVARYIGVPENFIVPADGEDIIVAKIIDRFLRRGDAAAMPEPSYGIFRYAAQSAGIEVLDTGSDERFDLYEDSLIRLATEAEAVRLVFLSTPNNPTGKAISRETVVRVLETGVMTVLDESHVEFGGQSCAPLVRDFPNLVVMRGFKWASLNGLSIAYAVAAPNAAARLAAALPVESISGMALSAAESALRHKSLLDENLARLGRERMRMTSALAALPGVIVHPSAANFIFCQFPNHRGRDVAKWLFENGVKVRHYPAKEYRDGIRIRVGLPEDTDRFVATLKKSLA